jgi:catecholate siderophore receptor
MLMPSYAQTSDAIKLDTLTIEDRTIDTNPYAEPGAPYKAKKSGDERYKRDIADTPKNISVLTKTQIEDSGYTDLRQILDAQPGITLGTGENGNAFGDRYIIRGQEARSDVFVDGLRDPGMTIRESFATEQVEISKGPDSSFGGRGTTGGAINSVTKQASSEYDFTKLSTGFGTDRYTRITLDANKVISEQAAIRINALDAYQEVPDRGPTDRDRQGVALSGLFKPNTKLQFLVDYYGLRAKDNPDLGGFLAGTVPNRKPYANPPVYAQEQDFIRSDIDTTTLRVKYTIDPSKRITNATRVGKAENGYVATGARVGTYGTNSPNVGASTVTLSSHQGWQDVDYFANQTNFFLDRDIAGKRHEFIFGLEFTDHKVVNGLYRVTNSGQNCITGTTATTNNAWCVVDPTGKTVNGIHTIMNREISKGTWDSDWKIKTVSLSVMDTVDLSDKWTAFAGIRHDRYDYNLVTQSTTTLVQTTRSLEDTVFNYHAGVTYKVRPNGNVYFSYATSTDINGGESDVGSSGSYGGLAVAPDGTYNGEPERTQNLELGTKWNLFSNKLLATAAVFEITKSDVFETAITNAGDPNRYDNLGTLNTGKSRVRGIEFGLSGNITQDLSAQGGVAFMKAEVLESNNPARIGKTLSNFADHSASVQVRYQLTANWSFGAAGKYESEKYAGQPDTAASFSTATSQYSQPIPAYTVTDLFAHYRINKDANVRINFGNVTNKDYYLAGYQSGSFLYKGDARNVRVTLNYDF